jgi:hypothetical protein
MMVRVTTATVVIAKFFMGLSPEGEGGQIVPRRNREACAEAFKLVASDVPDFGWQKMARDAGGVPM